MLMDIPQYYILDPPRWLPSPHDTLRLCFLRRSNFLHRKESLAEDEKWESIRRCRRIIRLMSFRLRRLMELLRFLRLWMVRMDEQVRMKIHLVPKYYY